VTAPDFEAQAREITSASTEVFCFGEAGDDCEVCSRVAARFARALSSAFAAGERRGAEGAREAAAKECERAEKRWDLAAENAEHPATVVNHGTRAAAAKRLADLIRALPTEEPQK
jgi:hypothetical protein